MLRRILMILLSALLLTACGGDAAPGSDGESRTDAGVERRDGDSTSDDDTGGTDGVADAGIEDSGVGDMTEDAGDDVEPDMSEDSDAGENPDSGMTAELADIEIVPHFQSTRFTIGVSSVPGMDVPAGAAIPITVEGRTADGKPAEIPPSSPVTLDSVAFEVADLGENRFVLVAPAHSVISFPSASVTMDGEEMGASYAFRIDPDVDFDTSAGLIPDAAPRPDFFYPAAAAPNIGIGQKARGYIELTAVLGQHARFRSTIPIEAVTDATVNVTEGTGDVAQWSAADKRIEGVSEGEADVTLTADIGATSFSGTGSVKVIDGQLVGLVVRSHEMSPRDDHMWLQADWGCDVSYHLFERYEDADGDAYHVSVDWSAATVTYSPTGYLRLDGANDRLCVLKGSKVVDETIEYGASKLERTHGITGTATPTIRVVPDPIELTGQFNPNGTLKAFATIPGEQEKEITDSPFVQVDAIGPNFTYNHGLYCWADRAAGDLVCSYDNDDVPLADIDVQVSFLGGGHTTHAVWNQSP